MIITTLAYIGAATLAVTASMVIYLVIEAMIERRRRKRCPLERPRWFIGI